MAVVGWGWGLSFQILPPARLNHKKGEATPDAKVQKRTPVGKNYRERFMGFLGPGGRGPPVAALAWVDVGRRDRGVHLAKRVCRTDRDPECFVILHFGRHANGMRPVVVALRLAMPAGIRDDHRLLHLMK